MDTHVATAAITLQPMPRGVHGTYLRGSMEEVLVLATSRFDSDAVVLLSDGVVVAPGWWIRHHAGDGRGPNEYYEPWQVEALTWELGWQLPRLFTPAHEEQWAQVRAAVDDGDPEAVRRAAEALYRAVAAAYVPPGERALKRAEAAACYLRDRGFTSAAADGDVVMVGEASRGTSYRLSKSEGVPEWTVSERVEHGWTYKASAEFAGVREFVSKQPGATVHYQAIGAIEQTGDGMPMLASAVISGLHEPHCTILAGLRTGPVQRAAVKARSI